MPPDRVFEVQTAVRTPPSRVFQLEIAVPVPPSRVFQLEKTVWGPLGRVFVLRTVGLALRDRDLGLRSLLREQPTEGQYWNDLGVSF